MFNIDMGKYGDEYKDGPTNGHSRDARYIYITF